ncbi:MAG: hypothetical protein R2932_00130 [Caldilineaceae bacterium]
MVAANPYRRMACPPVRPPGTRCGGATSRMQGIGRRRTSCPYGMGKRPRRGMACGGTNMDGRGQPLSPHGVPARAPTGHEMRRGNIEDARNWSPPHSCPYGMGKRTRVGHDVRRNKHDGRAQSHRRMACPPVHPPGTRCGGTTPRA